MRWMHSQTQRGTDVHEDEVERGFRRVLHHECDVCDGGSWRVCLLAVRVGERCGPGVGGRGRGKGREKGKGRRRGSRGKQGEYTRSRTPAHAPGLSLLAGSRKIEATTADVPRAPIETGHCPKCSVTFPERAGGGADGGGLSGLGIMPGSPQALLSRSTSSGAANPLPSSADVSRTRRCKPALSMQPVCERVGVVHLPFCAVCTDWSYPWLQRA